VLNKIITKQNFRNELEPFKQLQDKARGEGKEISF